jgi:hypothetical protein
VPSPPPSPRRDSSELSTTLTECVCETACGGAGLADAGAADAAAGLGCADGDDVVAAGAATAVPLESGVSLAGDAATAAAAACVAGSAESVVALIAADDLTAAAGAGDALATWWPGRFAGPAASGSAVVAPPLSEDAGPLRWRRVIRSGRRQRPGPMRSPSRFRGRQPAPRPDPHIVRSLWTRIWVQGSRQLLWELLRQPCGAPARQAARYRSARCRRVLLSCFSGEDFDCFSGEDFWYGRFSHGFSDHSSQPKPKSRVGRPMSIAGSEC